MNRIEATFIKLKKEGKKAHISFLTAGDPSIDQTFGLVQALIEGGSDIVEIGVPYSDPLADGPVIQAASTRALAGGVTVEQVFELAAKCRTATDIPLLFLMYANTLMVYGVEKFIARCAKVGIDGLIIPDIPYEEREVILPYMKKYGVEMIPLVAPTSKDRVPLITSECNGFVYCVSSLGVTGRTSEFADDIEDYIRDVKSQTSLPVAIGFGITDYEDVKRLESMADGVIVGSAIVKEIERSDGDAATLKAFTSKLFLGL
ncbi:MAG: tryptophan synthase subunit alpha [Firmicutes bacterium HGW-Firmicutes-2]|jgi:tryptophan synthase alpha chain|nr:MAG: tryptophan synthase subunit alpha [Firmicutes bacterium HGW-Firmicutes-2]